MALVAPSFHDDAMSAELTRQEAGWFLWFALPSARALRLLYERRGLRRYRLSCSEE